MLPQATAGEQQLTSGDCNECDVLMEISDKIESLVGCASGEEGMNTKEADVRQAEATEEEGSGDKAEPVAECMSPDMYAMDLISLNELIDTEIKNLYNSLIAAIEKDKRGKLFKKLEYYKSVRNTVDDIITKLMGQTDEEKLKKIVTRGLRRVNTEMMTKFKDCQVQCGGSGGCESCAADVLYDAIAKMNDYRMFFTSTDDEETKKEFVRTDMIRFITDNSNEAREILIKKATERSLSDCEQEKLDIFKITKYELDK